jgi:hypothetical protein
MPPRPSASPTVRLAVRLTALAMFAASVALTLSVWNQTGRLPDTRAPSEALAAMAVQPAEAPADDPFAELGMNDAAGAPKPIDNHFRLGLIPGLSSWGDTPAAATLLLPSFVLTMLVFVFTRAPKVQPAA